MLSTLTPQDFSSKPIKLPEGYNWTNITDYNKLAIFLSSEYVGNNYASLLYSPDMLEWILTPPDVKPDWHLGIEVRGELIACIIGIPKKILIDGKSVAIAEVNLLAVDRRLRDKNMSTVLIYELTRRIGLSSYTSAIYTCAHEINMDKRLTSLSNIGSSSLSQMPCTHLSYVQFYNRTVSVFKSLPNMREMRASDIGAVIKLSPTTRLSHDWDVNSASHYLLPRKDVLLSYVMCDRNGTVIGYITCYLLPSVNKVGKTLLPLGYLYHHSHENLLPMAKYLITQLHNMGVKGVVMGCLSNNADIIGPLQFRLGNGGLNYYTWNNVVDELEPKDINIITV